MQNQRGARIGQMFADIELHYFHFSHRLLSLETDFARVAPCPTRLVRWREVPEYAVVAVAAAVSIVIGVPFRQHRVVPHLRFGWSKRRRGKLGRENT